MKYKNQQVDGFTNDTNKIWFKIKSKRIYKIRYELHRMYKVGL